MVMSDLFYRRFSLITTCHGRWPQLLRSFETWLAQDYPNIEYVVVASGEDDSPLQLAEHAYFKGRIVRIRNAPFFRPSHYRNLGVSYARGEYLGFVDSDIFLKSSQWVSICVSQLRRYADLVVAKSLYDGADTGGCSGSFATARWLFEKVRGYNENLDDCWGYEDTDLYVRMQRAGGRISTFPDQTLQHQPHTDAERGVNFKQSGVAPRAPKTFIRQLRICDLDDAAHRYEANRLRRFDFVPETITTVEK